MQSTPKKTLFSKLNSWFYSLFERIRQFFKAFIGRKKPVGVTAAPPPPPSKISPISFSPRIFIINPNVPNIPKHVELTPEYAELTRLIVILEDRLKCLRMECQRTLDPNLESIHGILTSLRPKVEMELAELRATRYALGSGLEKQVFLKQKEAALLKELEERLERIRTSEHLNIISFRHPLYPAHIIIRSARWTQNNILLGRDIQNLVASYMDLEKAAEDLNQYRPHRIVRP